MRSILIDNREARKGIRMDSEIKKIVQYIQDFEGNLTEGCYNEVAIQTECPHLNQVIKRLKFLSSELTDKDLKIFLKMVEKRARRMLEEIQSLTNQ